MGRPGAMSLRSVRRGWPCRGRNTAENQHQFAQGFLGPIYQASHFTLRAPIVAAATSPNHPDPPPDPAVTTAGTELIHCPLLNTPAHDAGKRDEAGQRDHNGDWRL